MHILLNHHQLAIVPAGPRDRSAFNVAISTWSNVVTDKHLLARLDAAGWVRRRSEARLVDGALVISQEDPHR